MLTCRRRSARQGARSGRESGPPDLILNRQPPQLRENVFLLLTLPSPRCVVTGPQQTLTATLENSLEAIQTININDHVTQEFSSEVSAQDNGERVPTERRAHTSLTSIIPSSPKTGNNLNVHQRMSRQNNTVCSYNYGTPPGSGKEGRADTG